VKCTLKHKCELTRQLEKDSNDEDISEF